MARLRAHHKPVRLSGGGRIADPLIASDRPLVDTGANGQRRTAEHGWQRVRVAGEFVDVEELFRWADALSASLRRTARTAANSDAGHFADLKMVNGIIKKLRRTQAVFTPAEQDFIAERRPSVGRRRARPGPAVTVDGVPVARRSLRTVLRRLALDLDRRGEPAAGAVLHSWADRAMDVPDGVELPPFVVGALRAWIRANGGTSLAPERTDPRTS